MAFNFGKVIGDVSRAALGVGQGGVKEFLKATANQIIQKDLIKDWNHAAKIFVDNNYARAPKHGSLYYVYFDIIDTSILDSITDLSEPDIVDIPAYSSTAVDPGTPPTAPNPDDFSEDSANEFARAQDQYNAAKAEYDQKAAAYSAAVTNDQQQRDKLAKTNSSNAANFKTNLLARADDRKKSESLSVLVKSVSLPKFSIETKTLNAYGRPQVIQNKIGYEPIDIIFHDDTGDVVKGFWYRYMDHYYDDMNEINNYSQFAIDRFVSTKFNDNRGFNPKHIMPFLRSIKIFSFNNKKFSGYYLMNPTIKSFRHGEHKASDGQPLENSMTIEYESVLYTNAENGVFEDPKPLYTRINNPSSADRSREGRVGNTVLNKALLEAGFAATMYDKRPSPITVAGGGTASVLGEGGLISALDEIRDTWSIDKLQAGFQVARLAKTATRADWKAVAASEANAVVQGAVIGGVNRLLNGPGNFNAPVNIPGVGNMSDLLPKASNALRL